MRSAKVRLSAVAATAMLASSCGIMGGGGAGGEESSVLRVACLGNDQRIQRVQAAAKAYQRESAGTKVQLECTGFANYFDKLATQFAAKDAPDVVMLTEQFLGEYADRGALRELGEGVDTSKLSKLAAAEGRTSKGRFGVAAGLNTMTLLANPDMFDAAGVGIPDDTTWTWEKYAETAAKITAKSAKSEYGSDAPNFGPALELWLRQRGKSTYTDGGDLGFTATDVTGFLEYVQRLADDKAIPPASVVTEQHKALEQSGTATNKSAMGWFWSSAAGAVTKASGSDIEILRPPSTSGSAEEAGLYFKPDSLWTVNARTEQVEEAERFVDFMVNDQEAGDAVLTSLGVPANTEVRDAIAAKVKGSDKAAVEYVDEISDELGGRRPAIPAGGGILDPTMNRYAMDVLFGRANPETAADKFVDKMSSAIEK